MRNNLAELTDINIDINVLQTEWYKQVEYSRGYVWTPRNYVELDFFTTYYKVLLESITDVVDETPKNYIIQTHDINLDWSEPAPGTKPSALMGQTDTKWYLNIAHKDDDRLTCVTLPVFYNRMEPVNFYDDDVEIPPRGKQITAKPSQVGFYSQNHPTIVNVNNFHNVRVLDTSEPRILIQISYDISFDELVSKEINTNII